MAAPKIGDIVHYVAAVGVHRPAIVLVNAGAKDPLDLIVYDPDGHYVKTVNNDALQPLSRFLQRIPKGAGNDALGTWHWPEGRNGPEDV